MNAIKQAKILRQKNELERDILINTIIAEAVKAYAEWNYYYENKQVYKEFLDNAEIRYNGVLRSSELGETRALDTLETKITVRNRSLELKQANLSLQKAKLYVSNFLWIEETPVEMQENLVPMVSENSIIENLGLPNFLGNTENLEEHPKLKSMQFELDGYDLDIKLKRNNLLPNINLEYNFLDKEYDELRNFTTSNYKAGVNVSFPLFLRKERGDLKLAKIKRENTELKLDQTKLKLSNKIKFTEQELLSLEEQLLEIRQIVEESEIMVTSEKRLFEIGESSIFLVNSRENKLIEAELKRNKIENEYYKAAAKLFENLRLNL
jgi:outer membrane protein TolC